jgi:hypothetical protein
MDGKFKKTYGMILFLQRGKDFPGNEMKNDDMGESRQASGNPVFDKLDNGCGIYIHLRYTILVSARVKKSFFDKYFRVTLKNADLSRLPSEKTSIPDPGVKNHSGNLLMPDV